ncbi:unnamed protein product [Phytomonas sp. Hart1]|nr:unnamed protein product [Phytomonas sp. Hart1]|eukprot:CCW68701.1 unnamed protein product [Phytomonas sp. isolate Hart1]
MWQSWKYPKKLLSTRLGPCVEREIIQRASVDPNITQPVKRETFSLLYDRLEFVHDLAELPPDGDVRQVADYALKCIDVLGMRNGCSHCELRIDRRTSSPQFGKPVLIELNPRMQGDVPRSTELVGYDQFTLLVYLSAAAATFSSIRNQLDDNENSNASSSEMISSSEATSSLPWPPTPQLYRSLVSSPSNAFKRITRHVVFFCAEKYGILFDLAAAKVKSLPTYLRHARENLFSFVSVWKTVCVSQTVDLFSSPGACVLQGTEDEIRRDTEVIRRMEQATIPSSIQCLSRRLIESIKATQAMNLELYLHERNRFSNKNQPQDGLKPASFKSTEDDFVTLNPEPGLNARMSKQDKLPCVCHKKLHKLNTENERMYTEWKNALLELEYPPLFMSEEDFSLIQVVRSSWNSMIPYSREQNVDIFTDCSALTTSEKESSFKEVAKQLNYFF